MFRFAVAITLSMLAAVSAQASVMHTIKFERSAVIMVWQGDELIGQGSEINLGNGKTDWRQPSLAGGGILEEIAYSENVSERKIDTLRIASNTPFKLQMSAIPSGGTVTLRLVKIGGSAQYGGPHLISHNFAETASPLLLDVPFRTAKSAGSPIEQSLEFEVIRTGDAARVSYTLKTAE